MTAGAASHAKETSLVDGSKLAGRRVLIIEDESMVSMLLEDTLGDIGCKVVGIGSRFAEAMEKARSLAFDVAILDINLNGEHTFPIAQTVADRGLAFVFATGYGSGNLPPSLRHVPVLQKPFQQHDVERALRAALG
jgi:CheY-like chemotaxis protein